MYSPAVRSGFHAWRTALWESTWGLSPFYPFPVEVLCHLFCWYPQASMLCPKLLRHASACRVLWPLALSQLEPHSQVAGDSLPAGSWSLFTEPLKGSSHPPCNLRELGVGRL